MASGRSSGRCSRAVPGGAGYAEKLANWAAASLQITVEIVRKRDAHAFKVLPRRWVLERTLAWISTHRRCARDNARNNSAPGES